jgi:tRNA dimethylallyltransferase
MSSDFPRAERTIYLTGPTGAGKSAVALELARRLDAEILSMDSMALYRGMDIGTAKPSSNEREAITHHLIDVLDPWEAADVARYLDWAEQAEAKILQRGRIALYVGGTPLYLKVLLRGLFAGPPPDRNIQQRLTEEASQLGLPELHQRLEMVDPQAARRISRHDLRRIIRALEVFETTGRPISEHQTTHADPAHGRTVLAILPPRDELRRRIDDRAARMFDRGLIEETDRLRSHPRGLHPVPAQAVGYQESLAYLDGRITRAQAIERTQSRTRQIAKRQQTWFRGLKELHEIQIGVAESAQDIAARLHRELVVRREN